MTWAKAKFQSLFAEPSRNGVYKSKEHHGFGAKIINMGELFAHDRIGTQEMARLQMTDQELTKSSVINGDLLFGRRSLVEEGAGRCALAWNIDEPTTFESSIIRVRLDQKIANSVFYFYYFRSPAGRARIRSIVSGATVKGIRSSDLQQIEIDQPPLNVQSRIALQLSHFDDLIETNRRRIALLEESARLLYREWFVKLRFPGNETMKIVSGLPADWKLIPLSKAADFINGYAFKPAQLKDYGLPVVKIPELRGGVSDKTPKNPGDSIPERNKIDAGDLLFSWSATLLVNEWSDGPALLNQHLFKVNPRGAFPKRYIRFALEAAIPFLLGHSVGATMQHIRKSALDEHSIYAPSTDICDAFSDVIDPVCDQIITLKKQIKQLIAARDELLPKLMSGTIRV